MTQVKIKVKISNHAAWDNTLEIEGEYEIVKKELDKFYVMTKNCIKEANRNDAIQNRAYETWEETQEPSERINWDLRYDG